MNGLRIKDHLRFQYTSNASGVGRPWAIRGPGQAVKTTLIDFSQRCLHFKIMTREVVYKGCFLCF